MSLAAVLKSQRINNSRDISVVMIDSHADIHSYETSPSGNFHGMWLRAFFGDVGIRGIDKLIQKKLSTKRLSYLGNLVLEPAEEEFLKKNKIGVHSQEELINKDQDQKTLALIRQILKLLELK